MVVEKEAEEVKIQAALTKIQEIFSPDKTVVFCCIIAAVHGFVHAMVAGLLGPRTET